MGDTGQNRQHHAKTMIQRDGNAQSISLGELHSFPRQITIVEDVAVSQRCALGLPVVPLVNWILIASSGFNRFGFETTAFLFAAELADGTKIKHAGGLGISHSMTVLR